ncbi:MAG TPA: GNAT family N-acetyltransferase [Waddliaceae bacterium]
MTFIQLFDHSTIDRMEWPATEEAEHARALLLPMVLGGVQSYIHNVDTKLYLMRVNNAVIPITVNQREYDNSYLTSNYFPIKYLEERLNKQKSRLAFLQKPLIKGMGLLLKGIKINKAVIVNNWLLTTNIYPHLTQHELHAVTQYLTKCFPDHVLIFRSLNSRKCVDLTRDLEKQRYKLLYSRNVLIYDPSQKEHFSSKVLYHHRRDRRLIGTEGYEIVRSENMQTKELARMLQLYNSIYLSRHTAYSPQYTEKFLKEALEKGFLHFVCLKKDGEIHGVIGFHERRGTLITPFCGFDQSKGEANHLYRMLTILAIDEAEKREAILNDGSGGTAPKQYRGMRPFPEYVALYDRHLPCHRRFFWWLAEKGIKWLAFDKTHQAQPTSEH